MLAASISFSEGNIEGVKIDLLNWSHGEDTYSGSVIISGSTLEEESIKLSDNSLLTGTNFFIETLEGNGEGG